MLACSGVQVADSRGTGNDLEPENGTFARLIAVKGDLQIRIPDDVSFEAAATVGGGALSAGYGLYKVLSLPWPVSEPKDSGETLFVYGGSTATGTLAIQFARLSVNRIRTTLNVLTGLRSGWKVITASSPKHFDLMKDRGASAVFDYVRPQLEAERVIPD